MITLNRRISAVCTALCMFAVSAGSCGSAFISAAETMTVCEPAAVTEQCGPLREITFKEPVLISGTEGLSSGTISADKFLAGSGGSDLYGPSDSIVAAVSRAIKAAANNYDKNVDIRSLGLNCSKSEDMEKISAAISYAVNETPELFFVGRNIGYSYYTSGLIDSLSIEFISEKDDLTEYSQIFSNKVSNIVDLVVDDDMSEMQKALVLHDYIVLNTEYDLPDPDTNQSAIPDLTFGYSAYDILLYGNGVCQGYALAYKALLKEAGIDSVIVTSSAMNHAWNLVKIDGYWYHADATWDDPTPDHKGFVRHNNFLLSDSGFSTSGGGKHHSWSIMDTELRASSDMYDDAFWADVKTEFIYDSGMLYYIDDSGVYCGYSEISGETEKDTLPGGKTWYASVGDQSGYWPGCYSSLAYAGGKVYYNTPDTIYVMNPDGSKKNIFSQVDVTKAGGYIYGLHYLDSVLYAVIAESPNESGHLYRIAEISQVHEHTPGKGGVCKDCLEPADGRAGFASASLTLTDGVTMNYRLKVSDELLKELNDLYVEFSSEDRVKTIGLDEAVYDAGSDAYIFSIPVRPDRMTEDMTGRIVYSDGTEGAQITYSVREYCNDLAGRSDVSDKYKDLTARMLRYGAFSQRYTGYRSDDPACEVDTYKSESYPVIPDGYNSVLNGRSDKLSLKAASLMLGGNTSIRIRYRLESGTDPESLSFSCKDQSGKSCILRTERSGWYIYAVLEDIRPQDLDEMFTFTVNDGTSEISLKYGAFTYFKSMLSKGTGVSTELKDLIISVYEYHLAAERL